ncbi:MAG: membrane protein insertion efficiency factor YidD [Pseudomonadota bacterium]
MIDKVIVRTLIILIGIYRYSLSYFLGRQCRFQPTCSQYAIEALQKHGTIVGGKFAIKRLLRCHPFSKKSGYDPVP